MLFDEDEQQERLKKLHEEKLAREINAVMSFREGRAFVARLLRAAQGNAYAQDAHTTAYNVGVKAPLISLEAQLKHHCFDYYMLMLKEEREDTLNDRSE